MASKGIEPKLHNLFHVNLDNSSNPTQDIHKIMKSHSPHKSRDEDDSLT